MRKVKGAAVKRVRYPGPKKAGQPLGYGLYKAVHRWRWGRGVVMFSPKGYRAVGSWRSMELALGLRPRPWITKIRRRRQSEAAAARRIKRL